MDELDAHAQLRKEVERLADSIDQLRDRVQNGQDTTDAIYQELTSLAENIEASDARASLRERVIQAIAEHLGVKRQGPDGKPTNTRPN